MKIIDWTRGASWDDLLVQGEREDLVIMRDGHAIALVSPFDDDDLDWYARECDPVFLESIASARQQIREGKTLSHDDLLRELDADVGHGEQ